MISKKRLILAYLLAPVIPAVIYYVWYEILNKTNVYAGSQITYLVMMFSLPISYLSCFIIGNLFVKLFRNRMSLVALKIVGAVMGAILIYLYSFIVVYLLNTQQSILPAVSELLLGAGFGVSIALTFGLIAGVPWKVKPDQYDN